MLEDLAKAVKEIVLDLGYPGLFVLIVLESTMVPVPSLLVMPFAGYLSAAVLGPLGIAGDLQGSPAHAFAGTLDDLALLGQELLAPSVVAGETLAEATSVQFPGLVGVLPGFGRMEPNDWGLGLELRDGKHPHWTGAHNSAATFGHFGRSGTFLWVDPARRLALGVLTDEPFGEWAATAWPALSDAVLAEARAS